MKFAKYIFIPAATLFSFSAFAGTTVNVASMQTAMGKIQAQVQNVENNVPKEMAKQQAITEKEIAAMQKQQQKEVAHLQNEITQLQQQMATDVNGIQKEIKQIDAAK